MCRWDTKEYYNSHVYHQATRLCTAAAATGLVELFYNARIGPTPSPVRLHYQGVLDCLLRGRMSPDEAIKTLRAATFGMGIGVSYGRDYDGEVRACDYGTYDGLKGKDWRFDLDYPSDVTQKSLRSSSTTREGYSTSETTPS